MVKNSENFQSFQNIKNYSYPVAVPAPTLYSQFSHTIPISAIHKALLSLGFKEVYDVSEGYREYISAVREELKFNPEKPVFGSACPKVIKFIEKNYPKYKNFILDFDSPAERALKMLEKKMTEKSQEYTAFHITPCPEKMLQLEKAKKEKRIHFEGIIKTYNIYPALKAFLDSESFETTEEESPAEVLSMWDDSQSVPKMVTIEDLINLSEFFETGSEEIQYFLNSLGCRGGCFGGAYQILDYRDAKQIIKRRLS